MTVGEIGMTFDEDIDDTSEAVIIVCLFLFLRLRKVKLMLADALLNQFIVIEFYLKLLMKEFTARSCANSILLNDVP